MKQFFTKPIEVKAIQAGHGGKLMNMQQNMDPDEYAKIKKIMPEFHEGDWIIEYNGAKYPINEDLFRILFEE